MGRKVKNRAFEEEGEATRLPSNTEVEKFMSNILKKRAELNQHNADARADIRAVYDDAANAGLDKKVLKMAISIAEKNATLSYEDKALCNIYLEKSGQYSFFALEADAEAA